MTVYVVDPQNLSRCSALDRKAKVDDIAVLDDVLFAFEPKHAVGAAGGHAFARNVIVIVHHFGADKTAFDVGMDGAGCQRRDAGGGRCRLFPLVVGVGREAGPDAGRGSRPRARPQCPAGFAD